MNKRNIMKEAAVLLLALVMVTSTLSVANTINTTPNVDMKEVQAPTPRTTDRNYEIFGYYNPNVTSVNVIGSNSPPLFIAIRMNHTELHHFNGKQILKLGFYLNARNASILNYKYDAKIWEGNKTSILPQTLLLNDTNCWANFSATGIEYFMHTYSSPVTVNDTKDYWIVMKVYCGYATANDDYPLVFDPTETPQFNVSLKSHWYHNSAPPKTENSYAQLFLSGKGGAWMMEVYFPAPTPDTTAPVTTCNLYGTMSGSVYIGPVTVSLSATDPGAYPSGVNWTKYKLDSGAWTPYPSTPITVANDGIHTFAYYSKDIDNNQEAVQYKNFTMQYYNITAIKGPIGLSVTVKNIALVNKTDITWSINLSGGIILVGKSAGGEINITMNQTAVLKDKLIVGFGKTTITVKIGGYEKKYSAMVLLFFVVGIKPL